MVLRGAARLTTLAVAFALSGACSPARAPEAHAVPSITLVDTAGAKTTLPGDLSRSRFTVVVFYSEHCPCFRVHEARLRDLARALASQGVRILFVDSEVSATPERDARAAAERGLPAIALDPGAKLADALDADYATFAVVFDAQGVARYRGGIDSDKDRLTDDGDRYLAEALDDLLAGREPRRSEGKTLGCALQKH